MNFNFEIKRDREAKQYSWVSFMEGKKIKEPAEILASYQVYINKEFDRSFSFEIRKDEAGNIIIGNDDSLTEYLYTKKVNLKEVNDLCERICIEIHKDFFAVPSKE
ncbi:MAG: hypothetical protein EXR21_05945 [Flavobacteriaceae bacterium]|nr:hypothetical protein [Flavobacteriaceae bacterium]